MSEPVTTTSRLAQAMAPPDAPPIITIAGDAGVGKTSFCATFPAPIFMQIEEGMQSIPAHLRPAAFPPIKTIADLDNLWSDLTALLREPHDYKTLVIDSVTALEELFIEDVIKNDPKQPKSIAQAAGGYGAGFRIVASMHQRVRKAAGMLRERRGMNVVFIAHTDVENIDPPDGTPYSRWSLRLNKRSMQPYVDNVDIVGLVALESYRRAKTNDNDKSKAFSDGTRLISMAASVAHVSKNRYGITDDLRLEPGINPLIGLIPGLAE